MAGTALITGATAGLGAEFARQLGGKGVNLVLVARDTAWLAAFAAELSATYGVSATWLAADLSTASGRSAVADRLASTDEPIRILINNAGFGLLGAFEENSLADEQALLEVLVTAPLQLTHAALAAMLPRRDGVILNVASVAAFTPRGTYGAAKAWLVSFSRWANLYYRDRGIRVTALAPGFVRTEFHSRMKASTRGIPGALWLNAPYVVRIALRDVARGRAVSIPSLRYRILVVLSVVLPARVAAAGALRAR